MRRLRYNISFRKPILKLYEVYVRKLDVFLGVNEYDALLLYHPLKREFNKHLCAYLLPYGNLGLT